MNSDFVVGQLRLALTAFIAYAGGKGWFTPADSTLALALLTSLGPIAAPWLLSIIANYNTKHVAGDAQVLPDNAIAIVPKDKVQPFGTGAMSDGVKGTVIMTGKTAVSLMLATALLFAALPSAFAGPVADKIAIDLNSVRTTVVADLTAARDDAKANSDPAEICWQVLLNHANAMPVKLMGVAHTVQRARTLRRSIPALVDACAVVKDGARQAVLTIFGAAAGGVSGLALLGL